jgi:hypothetical protein
MRNIVESEEFALTWTLIGDPMQADAELEGLLHRVAVRGESFPVVVWPNERMATLSNNGKSIGIFFRILPNIKQVELLRLLVKNQSSFHKT